MATTPLSAIGPRLTPGEPAPKIEGGGRRLMFDWVAQEIGVYWSGFMLAGVVGTLLVTSVRASRGVAPVEVAMADSLICSTPAVGHLAPAHGDRWPPSLTGSSGADDHRQPISPRPSRMQESSLCRSAGRLTSMIVTSTRLA
jgi:hypothetical protein